VGRCRGCHRRHLLAELLANFVATGTGLAPRAVSRLSDLTADGGLRGATGRDGRHGYCDLRVCTLRMPNTAVSRR
jgi:hypothetical protein